MKMLIDKRTIRPNELKPGDVLAAIVTCHIQSVNADGTVNVRMYQCHYPLDTPHIIPQGGAMVYSEDVARSLFPVVTNRNDLAGEVAEWWAIFDETKQHMLVSSEGAWASGNNGAQTIFSNDFTARITEVAESEAWAMRPAYKRHAIYRYTDSKIVIDGDFEAV